MGIHLFKPLFPLGQTFATPGVLSLGVDLATYLRRHHCGDWGEELCAEDKQANEDALKQGDRILSCYNVGSGRRIYIITEWDRSVTTLLLPDEY